MTTLLIPLVNEPQTFEIALAGVNYLLTCKYNPSADAGWVLDIADANTNDPIAANIPLITGADCLAGLGYLGIDGQFWVSTDGNPDAVPTYDNLGVNSNLYFLTDATNG